MKKAIVLHSGGLDSTTALLKMQEMGYSTLGLIFDYGQSNVAEIIKAQQFAKEYNIPSITAKLSLDFLKASGSILMNKDKEPPKDYDPSTPSTPHGLYYVPARNTMFLSYAIHYALKQEASAIALGIVQGDGSPDRQPIYIEAYQHLINTAGYNLEIILPLIKLPKTAVIELAINYGIDLSQTVSCYTPTANGYACGQCRQCWRRRQSFKDLGISDPTIYQEIDN